MDSPPSKPCIISTIALNHCYVCVEIHISVQFCITLTLTLTIRIDSGCYRIQFMPLMGSPTRKTLITMYYTRKVDTGMKIWEFDTVFGKYDLDLESII